MNWRRAELESPRRAAHKKRPQGLFGGLMVFRQERVPDGAETIEWFLSAQVFRQERVPYGAETIEGFLSTQNGF